MVSIPLPISAKDAMALGTPTSFHSGAGPDPVPGGTQEGAELETLDLAALTQDLHHKINRIHNVDLQFSVHEGSGRIFVTVMDATTGEVIREIPPSEMLNLATRLDEMIGLLFDQVG